VPDVRYRRILVKMSGEALMGRSGYGIDPDGVRFVAEQIESAERRGVQVAVVIGGGNIWRGAFAAAHGIDRAQADYMGMLGTVINALALQDALEKRGIFTRVQTAIRMEAVAEPYIRRRAIRHLEKGRVVILAGGTGNPFFTTDSAAALRAIELEADVILMAKNGVDGIYDDDPRRNPCARKFDRLPFLEAINLRLQVMDLTALTLCMDNNMAIIVFNVQAAGEIERIILGEQVGTLVCRDREDPAPWEKVP
jgi:uridylate kinase